MKNSIFCILSLFSLFSTACASWNGKIVDVTRGQEMTRAELLTQLASSNVIVIGEKHYTKAVQDEEGKLLKDVVTFTNKENQFSLSWEFLNASAQAETETLFNKLVSNEISTDDFLLKTQGSKAASVYSPMISATATLGGKLFGVNLSRDEKAPVIKGGLAALDPKLLPPDFKMGGANYLARFTETMKDHATPEQIKNYFAAQSLVDDVSAYNLHLDSDFSLKFLVIGAFHSMFNDGVVARLKERNQSSKIVNIEIIDAVDYTTEEIKTIFSDEIYGKRADYILFVNEPSFF